MARIFPMLILSALAYNYFAFLDPALLMADAVLLPLPSGATLALSFSDLVVLGSLLLLCVEIMKAASSSAATAVDHALSLLVFAACLVEFVVVDRVATPAFLFIIAMTMVDVVAGFAISLSAARRDMTLS